MPVGTDSRIVVIDDEQSVSDLIYEYLVEEKYSIVAFTDPTKAIAHIENNHVDLVLTDLIMGNFSGNQLLQTTLKHHSDAVVILMTAHPTVEGAISALKLGAYDFLIKPFKLELMKAAIKRGLAHQRVIRDNLHLRGQVEFLGAANACATERDLAGYLSKVLNSCRTELEAKVGAIVQVDPSTGSILRKVCDGNDEVSLGLVIDESLLDNFTYTKSRKPVIRSETIRGDNVIRYQLLVSKPIFIRRTLHGAVNLLIDSPSGKITPGQLDVLTILANSAAAAIGNENLYRELQSSYMQAIRALANSIEARDEHTAGHTDRVTTMASTLAIALGWGDDQLQQLRVGCTLHDIGKIGVPDSILNKSSSLSEQELKRMQGHPEVGLKIVLGIELFKPAVPYIISHHERFDGSGYPSGLKGNDIPVEGRLLAVVDTFDAIISDRPYRKGADLTVAVAELRKNSGSQFDPGMVEPFLRVLRDQKVDLEAMYKRSFDMTCLQPEIRATQKVSV